MQKVYRGLAGKLPQAMRIPDKWNARGGVELGFMSTTSDRAVAVEYASSAPGSLVLELVAQRLELFDGCAIGALAEEVVVVVTSDAFLVFVSAGGEAALDVLDGFDAVVVVVGVEL